MAVARHAAASQRVPPRARTARRRAVSLEGLQRCIRRAPRRFAASTACPPSEPIGDVPERAVARSIRDDLRLFATTFAAGFLFVSILIG